MSERVRVCKNIYIYGKVKIWPRECRDLRNWNNENMYHEGRMVRGDRRELFSIETEGFSGGSATAGNFC